MILINEQEFPFKDQQKIEELAAIHKPGADIFILY
jgi:hypothetical protein